MSREEQLVRDVVMFYGEDRLEESESLLIERGAIDHLSERLYELVIEELDSSKKYNERLMEGKDSISVAEMEMAHGYGFDLSTWFEENGYFTYDAITGEGKWSDECYEQGYIEDKEQLLNTVWGEIDFTKYLITPKGQLFFSPIICKTHRDNMTIKRFGLTR